MDLRSAAESSDADLVIRARRGDDTACELLMRAHQEAVFRLAYLFLHDADEAEDATQETFIRALRALDEFDLERPLRPWLLRIATNVVRNRQRAVGRYLQAMRRWLQSEPAPVAGLTERSGPQWEAQLLWQAVRRLARSDQEVLYLRYFLDLGEAEMAGALDMPPGTVKSRLHRATTRLRMIVDGEFPALREERQP
ncbi:MAG: sigma-70 family RNA polymerase sigma factor [Herpetosiphonaceae bacterium]|nr:sigma-70 family RNA polymerase sigma factor [Herpetosiphonaceae bacterium]